MMRTITRASMAIPAIALGGVMALTGCSSSTSKSPGPPTSGSISGPAASASASASARAAWQKAKDSATKKVAVPAAMVRVNPDDSHRSVERAAAQQGSPNSVGPTTFNSANTSYGKVAVAPNGSKMLPDRLLIPAAHIYVSIIPQGINDGFAVVPQQSWRVAWQNNSASLDATTGATVINGHVEFNGVPGAFANLSAVKSGDAAYYTDSAGVVHGWRATDSGALYRKGHLPQLFSTGKRLLAINTCGGDLGTVKKAGGGTEYAHLDNREVMFAPM